MAGQTPTDTREPESLSFRGRVERAIRLTERLDSLRYHDRDAIRATWGELTGQPVDETVNLIPPCRG